MKFRHLFSFACASFLLIACQPQKPSQEKKPAPAPTSLQFSNAANYRTVDWGEPVKKKLYATQNFHNQAAPEIHTPEWVSTPPENLKGKFVLVDFWATWCGPCVGLIPELNEISKKFANDLVVIGISSESASVVKGFKGKKIEYLSVADPKDLNRKQFGISGIPHVMLIDPSGKVCFQGFPGDSADRLDSARIELIIQKFKAAQQAP